MASKYLSYCRIIFSCQHSKNFVAKLKNTARRGERDLLVHRVRITHNANAITGVRSVDYANIAINIRCCGVLKGHIILSMNFGKGGSDISVNLSITHQDRRVHFVIFYIQTNV